MEKRQGEKRTDVFFFISFFFDFLPEGSAASWARDKQQPAVGSSSPSYPREECQGKVPMAPGARLSRQRWAPRRPGCPPSGAGAEEPHALQTCHSPTRDFETAQSKLASGFLGKGRNACFCYSCPSLPLLLGQASTTRMPLQEDLLTSPPLGHSPHIFIPQIFSAGTQALSHALMLALAQTQTLKLASGWV